MASKGTIAILTGGGDVPGLNPAIRAITIRALREGYRVVGIRRGWAGLVDYVPDKDADNADNVQVLSEAIVNRVDRTGGMHEVLRLGGSFVSARALSFGPGRTVILGGSFARRARIDSRKLEGEDGLDGFLVSSSLPEADVGGSD